jgi:phage head maturation protease
MAFTVGEDERTIKENKETNVVEVHRTITKVKKLFDVSAVSYPANDMTSISARQFSEGVIEELKQERLRAKAEAREAQIAKLRLRIRTIMEE